MKEPTIVSFDKVDSAANEKDSSSASDQDIPQSESVILTYVDILR